jgi:hypothetical protein
MSQPKDSKPKPTDISKPLPDDVLPPVQAPSAGFLLQLFLIPMIIVTIIVFVWLMFSWLAHMGSDPKELVRGLKTLNEASWQKAYTLSNLLRNPDYDHIKDDAELAGELASVLDAEIERGQLDEKRLRLRIFICRALGEFRVTTGLPALVKAIETERDPAEVDVRLAAIEAIAVLATNVGQESIQSDPSVMNALMTTARARSNAAGEHSSRDEMRSTTAFTLGVVGGAQATERLVLMLDDAHANTRYNAATGLARQGDERAVRVLVEMLDPENELAVKGERSDSERHRKRNIVLQNALQATAALARRNDTADLSKLRDAIQQLNEADVDRAVKLRATDALDAFQ